MFALSALKGLDRPLMGLINYDCYAYHAAAQGFSIVFKQACLRLVMIVMVPR